MKVVEKVSKILDNIDIPNIDQPANVTNANTIKGLSFSQGLKTMIAIFREIVFPLLLSTGELIVALVLLLIELPFFIVFCIFGPLSSTLRIIVFALSLTSILCLNLIDVTLIILLIHILLKHKRNSNHDDHPLSIYVKYADIFRLVFVEILNYPHAICTIIIDGIISNFYLNVDTPRDRYYAADFYLSLLKFMKVIVLRVVFVMLIIVSIRKNKHQSKKNLSTNLCCGLALEICFFIHVIGQTCTQMLIFIEIGAKIICENPNPDEEHIFISIYTWIMISVGFLLSLTGVFTFFVIVSGWLRAYPIKFMTILLEQLEVKENLLEYPERVKKSTKKLLELITKLKDVSDSFCSNIVHPFINLFLSLPSIHYLYLLLTS